MDPLQIHMLTYLYQREQRRERINVILFWSLLIAAVIIGGTIANIQMYKHGWK